MGTGHRVRVFSGMTAAGRTVVVVEIACPWFKPESEVSQVRSLGRAQETLFRLRSRLKRLQPPVAGCHL